MIQINNRYEPQLINLQNKVISDLLKSTKHTVKAQDRTAIQDFAVVNKIELQKEVIEAVLNVIASIKNKDNYFFSKKGSKESHHSLYVTANSQTKQAFITLPRRIYPAKKGSARVNEPSFKEALCLEFSKENKLKSIRHVAKMATLLDSNETVSYDSMLRRVAIAQHIKGEYFPEHYAAFLRASSKKGQKLELFQELANWEARDFMNLCLAKKDADLSTLEQYRYARDLVFAVEAMHSQGVIHRDLKPENILLTGHDPFPHLKISDFGLARWKSDEAVKTTRVGTFEWLSPEVLKSVRDKSSAETLGMPMDIWTLGLILQFVKTAPQKPPIVECLRELVHVRKLDNTLDQLLADTLAAGGLELAKSRIQRFMKSYMKDELESKISYDKALFKSLKSKCQEVLLSLWRSWEDHLKRLPPRPKSIRNLDDLIASMLQEHPQDRLTSAQAKEALVHLIKLLQRDVSNPLQSLLHKFSALLHIKE